MTKGVKLTQEQEAEIYCIKHGHANYIWNFFGYVHCGRCGSQIGDRLGGVFDTTDKIFVNHKCSTCDRLKKKLSSLDPQMLSNNGGNYGQFLSKFVKFIRKNWKSLIVPAAIMATGILNYLKPS